MMKIQMLALTPLLAATLFAAQAEVPGSPLVRAFADWKLAAATTASGPESLAALRALRDQLAASEANETLADLALEIEARLAALAPKDAQEPAQPAAKRAEDVVVAEAVVTAVRTGDLQLLEQLGERAVPALRSIAVREPGTTIPQGQLNPLEALFSLDTAAALDSVLALMESGDILKKSYAAAVLEKYQRLNRKDAWKPVGATDWAFARESWSRIVPAAFEEPALPPQNMVASLAALVTRGQVPPELEDLTFATLAHPLRIEILPEAGRAFFTRLLDHPNSPVRQSALVALQQSSDVEATYRLANDPEGDIREQVARALDWRMTREYADRSSGSTREAATHATMSAAYRAAVRRLAVDEERSIRREAIGRATRNVLAQGKPLFSVEELREFLGDIGDRNLLYEAALQISTYPAEERRALVLFCLDVAQRLPDRENESPEAALLQIDRYGLGTGADFWAIVEEFSARGLLSRELREQIRNAAFGLIHAEKTSGTRYIEWAARQDSPEVWPTVSKRTDEGTELSPWLATSSSAARAQAIRGLAKYFDHALQGLTDGRLAIDSTDLLALAGDDSAETSGRLWACRELVSQHPEAVTSDAMDVLLEVHAVCDSRSAVEAVMLDLEPLGKHETFLRGLIAKPATDEALLHRLKIAALDADTAEVVLERFPPATWADIESSTLVGGAIRALVAGTAETIDPRLEFANVRDSNHQATLAQAIGRNRAPALLPLLDRVLANATPGSTAWNIAVQSASGYFNDDAAALLLRAAREATTGDARQLAMEALKQMADWREASAAWERSAGATAKREVAIEELVALIEDAAQPVEVRAEALRGLGLLDAAEELPRLVRALTSAEAPIAAAARAALDRLNAK